MKISKHLATIKRKINCDVASFSFLTHQRKIFLSWNFLCFSFFKNKLRRPQTAWNIKILFQNNKISSSCLRCFESFLQEKFLRCLDFIIHPKPKSIKCVFSQLIDIRFMNNKIWFDLSLWSTTLCFWCQKPWIHHSQNSMRLRCCLCSRSIFLYLRFLRVFLPNKCFLGSFLPLATRQKFISSQSIVNIMLWNIFYSWEHKTRISSGILGRCVGGYLCEDLWYDLWGVVALQWET